MNKFNVHVDEIREENVKNTKIEFYHKSRIKAARITAQQMCQHLHPTAAHSVYSKYCGSVYPIT